MRHKFGRWSAIAAIVVLTSILSVIATWLFLNRVPFSPLTSDLTAGSWERSTIDFNARLQQRFPLGTPQQEMIVALAREGFVPEWPWSDGEHEAVRREDTIVCNIAARVNWRTDEARRLTAIRGVYREEGCL